MSIVESSTYVAHGRTAARMRAGPAARTLTPSPDATNGAFAPRGAERGLLVLTAGLVSYVLGVIPPTRWMRLRCD